MILAHLADLHLGFRAFQRSAADGANLRERDVAAAFRHAVDQVIALRPDLVVVAGDIFHAGLPSNLAVSEAFQQLSRLCRGRPDTPVIVVAGNHDVPFTPVESSLSLLAQIPGVHVADRGARRLHFPQLDTSVLCLPHPALPPPRPVEPDPSRGTNILVLHGSLHGDGVDDSLSRPPEPGGAQVPVADIEPARWTYVALGHHHTATRLATNVWYAGGLERTSAAIWEETEEKGFLSFDTETRETTFHAVPTRPVVDVPILDARRPDGGGYLAATELDALIHQRLESIAGGVEGKIVRLVIRDLPRERFRQLDHRRLREYRGRAFHLHLEPRRPADRSRERPHQQALEEETETFLLEEWQPVASEVSPDRLAALAALYFAQIAPTPDGG